ncbi:MAG: PEP-CTERM sorting domain-containing protein [Bryobacterales bacterium]|nr:PEP-CTERM sorting domain-containing protein [Bryobacterales bacterium]
MKLFFAMAMLAAASLQGAVINSVTCPAAVALGIPPGGNAACAGLGSVAGFTNLTLQMNYALDVTVDPFNQTGSMFTSLDAPLTNWDANPTQTVTNLNRILNVSGSNIAISETDYNANFLNAFNVFVGSSTFSGTATDGNVRIQFILSGDAVPTGQIPEPTTFALIGSALLGIGAMARRRS